MNQTLSRKDLHKFYSLTKHSAQGNTFIIATATKSIGEFAGATDMELQKIQELQWHTEESYKWRKQLARELCSSETGYGVDGLIFLDYEEVSSSYASNPGEVVGGKMELFNADGSGAEISGNGLRCLGQAIARKWGIYDLKIELAPFKLPINPESNMRSVKVTGISNLDETQSQEKSAKKREDREDSAGGGNPSDWVEVEVGLPVIKNIPRTDKVFKQLLDAVSSDIFAAWEVNVGNPHLVLRVKEGSLENIDIKRDGKKAAELARDNGLGDLNVEFIDELKSPEIIGATEPDSKSNGENEEFMRISELSYINLKVYERGVGATKACGSGAVAGVIALQKSNEAGRYEKIRVKMDGGDVVVFATDLEVPNSNVKLTLGSPSGPTKTEMPKASSGYEKTYWLGGEVEFLGYVENIKPE